MQTVLLPLEVILRRARGTVVLGIDRSVWYARPALHSSAPQQATAESEDEHAVATGRRLRRFFYLAHTAGPVFLYFCSPLHDRVHGGHPASCPLALCPPTLQQRMQAPTADTESPNCPAWQAP